MNPTKTIYPASWSRQRRSAVTIMLAMMGMGLFLWSLSSILSVFPSPIGPAAAQFASGAVVTLQLTVAAAPLAWLGRWSLSWYMLHQPVLIGFLMAVAALKTLK